MRLSLSLRNLAWAIGGILASFAVWEILRLLGGLPTKFVPGIIDVLSALVIICRRLDFWLDVGSSVLRAIGGTAIGVICGVPVGALLGLFRPARLGLLPIVDFLRALPSVALLPALVTAFGLGETTKTLLVAIPTGLLMTAVALHACLAIPTNLLDYIRARGVRRSVLWMHIYLPAVTGSIPSGLTYSLPLAFVLSIVADMFFGTDVGLGSRLIRCQELFLLPELYATIFVTGIVGVIFAGLINFLRPVVTSRIWPATKLEVFH